MHCKFDLVSRNTDSCNCLCLFTTKKNAWVGVPEKKENRILNGKRDSEVNAIFQNRSALAITPPCRFDLLARLWYFPLCVSISIRPAYFRAVAFHSSGIKRWPADDAWVFLRAHPSLFHPWNSPRPKNSCTLLRMPSQLRRHRRRPLRDAE